MMSPQFFYHTLERKQNMASEKISRRDFCAAAGAGALSLSALSSQGLAAQASREMFVYVGTYTTGKSEGIYLYRLNPATGALARVGAAGGVKNPSFIALDPRRRFLYAVSEVGEFNGQKTGAVAAFSINQKTGALALINQQPSRGTGPCYVTTDRGGRNVLVANYGGGSVAAIPVRSDGGLAEPSDGVQHTGTGADPKRQQGPHAHCIVLDAAGRYAFAPDLGLDKVVIYKFDAARGKFTPGEQPSYQTAPGAGPRHFTFHPDGKHAFVINELNSTISALAYDAARGALKELHTISTLPRGFSGSNYCADVHVHPNGRFVYGSNRGHDSIGVFAFDAKAGKLSFVEAVPTGGKWPRNFAVDPTGALLLAANQNTDNVVVFRIDAKTGRLTPTGQAAEIHAPVCLKLTPAFS
jgi:6-phosphogluconolactonase